MQFNFLITIASLQCKELSELLTVAIFNYIVVLTFSKNCARFNSYFVYFSIISWFLIIMIAKIGLRFHSILVSAKNLYLPCFPTPCNIKIFQRLRCFPVSRTSRKLDCCVAAFTHTSLKFIRLCASSFSHQALETKLSGAKQWQTFLSKTRKNAVHNEWYVFSFLSANCWMLFQLLSFNTTMESQKMSELYQNVYFCLRIHVKDRVVSLWGLSHCYCFSLNI